jgi:copper chaperone CopZ
MNKHTLTVQFDDEKASVDQMVKALGKAGYTVPSFQKSPE